MPQPYSQSRALWAITRASFKAIFAQPTAIVFSLIFPIVFILIFGAFGKSSGPSYSIAISHQSDTANAFYAALKKNVAIRIASFADTTAMNSELTKGKLVAVVDLQKNADTSKGSHITVKVKSTEASGDKFPGFMQLLDYSRLQFEANIRGHQTEYVQIEQPVIAEGKKYKQIDFILPGQLGFSILFSTLFGIAFTFFTLREQLVLKRFYASPVNRINILLGIGASRLFFQLINVVVLVLFGYFFLGFTLQHGALTVIEMILLSIVMLFLLMGAGLIISSISKNDSNIPLLINLFGFPQMLLAGTFFPITVFPAWLQQICRLLPLTFYNDAMRKISFEGLHLYQCWREILGMGVWIVIIYIVLSRVIKWE